MNESSPADLDLEWPHAPLQERDAMLAALEAAWLAGDLAEHEPVA